MKKILKKKTFVDFVKKRKKSDKFRDHCHLTSKYRGSAYTKCNINVKQKDSKSIPFIVHSFSNHDCHLFFNKLVDKKNDKLKFDINPKTDEEYISNIWLYRIYRQ